MLDHVPQLWDGDAGSSRGLTGQFCRLIECGSARAGVAVGIHYAVATVQLCLDLHCELHAIRLGSIHL